MLAVFTLPNNFIITLRLFVYVIKLAAVFQVKQDSRVFVWIISKQKSCACFSMSYLCSVFHFHDIRHQFHLPLLPCILLPIQAHMVLVCLVVHKTLAIIEIYSYFFTSPCVDSAIESSKCNTFPYMVTMDAIRTSMSVWAFRSFVIFNFSINHPNDCFNAKIDTCSEDKP